MFKFNYFFISIILIFIFLFFWYFKFHKIILDKKFIKHALSDKDKFFLDKYSVKLKPETLKNIIFYTDKTWSTKFKHVDNYIYDKINERYYVIDKGYFYFIDNLENFDIICSLNLNYLDTSKFLKNIKLK